MKKNPVLVCVGFAMLTNVFNALEIVTHEPVLILLDKHKTVTKYLQLIDGFETTH